MIVSVVNLRNQLVNIALRATNDSQYYTVNKSGANSYVAENTSREIMIEAKMSDVLLTACVCFVGKIYRNRSENGRKNTKCNIGKSQ